MVHCRLCRNAICAHVAARVANARVRCWACGDSFRWLPGSARWWHRCCEHGHIRWLWRCEVLLAALSTCRWKWPRVRSLDCGTRRLALLCLYLDVWCSVITLRVALPLSVAILRGSTRCCILGLSVRDGCGRGAYLRMARSMGATVRR